MMRMPMEVADPYGLLSPERRQNPYPIYARLLREAPVHFSEPWGAWVVTRHADVNAGFRDMRLSSVRTGMYSRGMPEEVVRKLAPMGRNMQVAPGALPEWVDNVGFRGLQSLPVVLGPAA